MTAHATMEEKQRCLAAGMNDHVSKPIDPGALFETVGRFYHAKGEVKGDAPRGRSERPSADELEIPSVAGLDAAEGLLRVAGNRKLYLKLLRQFSAQQAEAPARIARTARGRRSGHGGTNRAHRQGRGRQSRGEGGAGGGGRAGEGPARTRGPGASWKHCASSSPPFWPRSSTASAPRSATNRPLPRSGRRRRGSRAAEVGGHADDHAPGRMRCRGVRLPGGESRGARLALLRSGVRGIRAAGAGLRLRRSAGQLEEALRARSV